MQNDVYFHCCKLLGHRENALDVTQEVLIAMVTNLPKLKEPAAFHAWLLKIVYTRCKNQQIRGPRECQIPETEEGNSLLDLWAEDNAEAIPDQALERAETTSMLRQLVEELTPEQRVCVLLYYYDELKLSEIAQVLSLPETTVKSRLHHARRALKAGILQHEQQYVLSLAPVLGYLFRSEAQKEGLAASEAARLTASALFSTATVAGTAATGSAALGVIGKILVVTAALGVTAGGLWALRDLRRTKPPEIEEQYTEETVETVSETLEERVQSVMDPADLPAWEERLEQSEFFQDDDEPFGEPQVDIGAGWYDSLGLLHLEYRNYSDYPWFLREIVIQGDSEQWTIVSDGLAAGLLVTEEPRGTPLTGEELTAIRDWLREDGHRMRMQFLTSDYRALEEISLFDFFYNGSMDRGDWHAPVAEQLEVLGHRSTIDVMKITSAEAESILQELDGISMSACQGYGLEQFAYSEPYDAYYHEHGDTNATSFWPWAGWRLPDGTVHVKYDREGNLYEVCLRPNGPGWTFVSNRPFGGLDAVDNAALKDLTQLSEKFVTSYVIGPLEAGLPEEQKTFASTAELKEDTLVKLFCQWAPYNAVTAVRREMGFHIPEELIRETLDQYFSGYQFDITRCAEYNETTNAVLLLSVISENQLEDLRLLETQIDDSRATYTVGFYENEYDGPVKTEPWQVKVYEVEYRLNGWNYLSVRNG